MHQLICVSVFSLSLPISISLSSGLGGGRQYCSFVVITETFGIGITSSLCVLLPSEKCWQQLCGQSQSPTNPAGNCELVWSFWGQLEGIVTEHAEECLFRKSGNQISGMRLSSPNVSKPKKNTITSSWTRASNPETHLKKKEISWYYIHIAGLSKATCRKWIWPCDTSQKWQESTASSGTFREQRT